MLTEVVRASKFTGLVRWALRIAVLLAAVICLLSGWLWWSSERGTVQSEALGEARDYRVFNPGARGALVYALDGQTIRNGLSPAVLLTLGAIVQGKPLPQIVAIHSNSSRDRDFRPATSTPTYWRPNIVGHAPKFDRFLFDELFPKFEHSAPPSRPRYLLGHSLAGLYALDLAARRTGHFTGVFAFAPTFSHDTSIMARLPLACGHGTLLYANWGLESARDTAVFQQTVAEWKAAKTCRGRPPLTARHHGSLHQTIMVTGQIDTAIRLID